MSEERKFLHELSNSMAIGFGNIRILLNKLEKKRDECSDDYILEKIRKAVDAYEKVNSLIEDRRDVLKSGVPKE